MADPAAENTELRDSAGARCPGRLESFPPRRWHLLLAGAPLAAVYLAGVTALWSPSPDSALYLGLGRSLANGEGYRFNGAISTSVTPGLPGVLGGLRLAFGPGFWAPNLLMALCGLGALLAAYLAVARLSDRRTALAVAVGTGASFPFYNNAHRILTDAPFVLLFWALVYACLRALQGRRGWLVWAGMLSAAGILIRAPGALIIGPLAAGLVLDGWSGATKGRRMLTAAVVLAGAVIAGGVLYALARATGAGEPAYIASSATGYWITKRLFQLGQGLAELPGAVCELFTSQEWLPGGLALLAVIAIGLASLWRRRQRSATAVLVLYPLLLILLGGWQSIRPRYLLPALPLAVYAAIEGLCWIVQAVARRWRRFSTCARRRGDGPAAAVDAPAAPKALLVAVTALVGTIVACNVPKVARQAFYHSYLSYTGQYYQQVRAGQHAELLAVADLLRRECPAPAIVAAPSDKAAMLHFLTEQIVAPFPVESCRTAADADKVLDFLRSGRRADFIVVSLDDDKGRSRPFLDRLLPALEAMPDLTPIYRGDDLAIFRRAER